MTAPRVVLDTNVVISALLFTRGRLSWIRSSWQRDILIPLASRATILEIVRVLAYPKFRLTDEERHQLLGDYLPWCEVVEVPAELDLPACRDSDDVKFTALAIAGNADYLVSGDADLTSLEDLRLQVITPASLRELLQK